MEMAQDTLRQSLTKANRLIVLEHLYAALREGVSSTVLHHLMAAIRELERN